MGQYEIIILSVQGVVKISVWEFPGLWLMLFEPSVFLFRIIEVAGFYGTFPSHSYDTTELTMTMKLWGITWPLAAMWSRVYRSETNLMGWQFDQVKSWSWAVSVGGHRGWHWAAVVFQWGRNLLPPNLRRSQRNQPGSASLAAMISFWSLVEELGCLSARMGQVWTCPDMYQEKLFRKHLAQTEMGHSESFQTSGSLPPWSGWLVFGQAESHWSFILHLEFLFWVEIVECVFVRR